MTVLPSHRPTRSHRHLRPLRAAFACLALSVCIAPGAAFASGDDVVKDCAEDSQLSKDYSQQEYKDALADIPADVDQYTDCRDVIRRAQLKAAGAGGGGGAGSGFGGTGGGGTGTPGGPGGNGLNAVENAIAAATPAERDALTKAMTGGEPVTVGGREISPSALTRGDLSTSTSIPGPLLAVLILLGLGAVAALTPTLRTVVRSRRHSPIT